MELVDQPFHLEQQALDVRVARKWAHQMRANAEHFMLAKFTIHSRRERFESGTSFVVNKSAPVRLIT
jgi:hypothetical protein